ncbi:MAG TPA: hypothetical protein PLK31_11640 [Chloroflexota bacterium]|nr:hypothetical protein [Chloroflexota bacterium]
MGTLVPPVNGDKSPTTNGLSDKEEDETAVRPSHPKKGVEAVCPTRRREEEENSATPHK